MCQAGRLGAILACSDRGGGGLCGGLCGIGGHWDGARAAVARAAAARVAATHAASRGLVLRTAATATATATASVCASANASAGILQPGPLACLVARLSLARLLMAAILELAQLLLCVARCGVLFQARLLRLLDGHTQLVHGRTLANVVVVVSSEAKVEWSRRRRRRWRSGGPDLAAGILEHRHHAKRRLAVRREHRHANGVAELLGARGLDGAHERGPGERLVGREHDSHLEDRRAPAAAREHHEL